MKFNRVNLFCVFVLAITPYGLTASYEPPTISSFPGDLNSDQTVDFDDLDILKNQWLQGPGEPNADIAPAGGDGIVNFLDFSVLAKDWLGDYALAAARSGIECGKYLAATATGLGNTAESTVTSTQANNAWTQFCTYVRNQHPGDVTVPVQSPFSDAYGSGSELIVPPIGCGSEANFTIRFYRYDSDPLTIRLESQGSWQIINRTARTDFKVKPENEILQYAIAGKGRIWLAGDTTIYGNIYSSWKYQNLSPFAMTSDSTVNGTINTILSNINPVTGLKGSDLYADTTLMPYHLETLDADGNPMFDENGDRIYSPQDQVQAYHEGINYGILNPAIPGMDIADYDTSQYKAITAAIPTSSQTRIEYFPHIMDDYTVPLSGSSRQLTRHVYENQTFTDARVPYNRNALFKTCIFEGILYVDCSTTGGANYNNVRFENCTFRGPIITNTPHYSVPDSSNWWMKNCLYFTGTETFQNQTSVPSAILAPNFEIKLGNIDLTVSDDNVLTGAIIGGIVDIYGTAQINGTIISMFDTSMYPSGYVSNIGEIDDGSESVEVGTITITPDPAQMLPSGITTPITIVPLPDTYLE